MVILRTDAGKIIGCFKNVRAAQAYAAQSNLDGRALVVQSKDGVVLSRRFATD